MAAVLCAEYRALENPSLSSSLLSLFVSRSIDLSLHLRTDLLSLSIFLFLYLSWPHFAPTLYKYVSLLWKPPRGRLRDVYNTRERFKTIREYKPALSQECRGGAAA